MPLGQPTPTGAGAGRRAATITPRASSRTSASSQREAASSQTSKPTLTRSPASAASRSLPSRSSRPSQCPPAPSPPSPCASPRCTTAPSPPAPRLARTLSTIACRRASLTSCTPSPSPTWSGPPRSTPAALASITRRLRSTRRGSVFGGPRTTSLTPRRTERKRKRTWRMMRTATPRKTAGKRRPGGGARSTTLRTTARPCGPRGAGCSASAT
mmetsp:Transcript_8996/g.23575  ORF Transcript_8996/g.23575 Transcript_8996/m.23575 type:complete len:213 (+) Transcript_8996:4799-5437(+)